MAPPAEAILFEMADAPDLDLTQFQSVDEALARVARPKGFDDIARATLSPGGQTEIDLTLGTMFFMSAVTRARALYDAAVREAEASNPPATFTLIRKFAETVAVVFYVADHPRYIETLMDRPSERAKGAPARRSIQAIIGHLKRSGIAANFGPVYAELCEITHFGSLAMWNPHRADDRRDEAFSWTSYPTWRNDREALIACAQLLELAEAMEEGLRRLGDSLVPPSR